MDVSSRDEREEERARQRRVAEELKASGALEGIFAQVDAGAPLTGSDGVLSGVVKAALEQGLAAELTEHLGYASGETRTRVRIPTRATEAVLRRSPLRAGGVAVVRRLRVRVLLRRLRTAFITRRIR